MDILQQKFDIFYGENDIKHLSLWEILALKETTILYFYPKDDTPGCTLENMDFSSLEWEFEKLGIALVWVSRDTKESHGKFCKKYGLKNPLISDPEMMLHKYFWAFGEKNNYGKIVTWVLRSSFLVDTKWEILKSWVNIKATGHALRLLKELQNEYDVW